MVILYKLTSDTISEYFQLLQLIHVNFPNLIHSVMLYKAVQSFNVTMILQFTLTNYSKHYGIHCKLHSHHTLQVSMQIYGDVKVGAS